MAKKGEARQWEVRGLALRCLVCDGERFHDRDAQLNTAVATFLGFDWANKTARCLICEDCGHVHWFMPTPGASLEPAD